MHRHRSSEPCICDQVAPILTELLLVTAINKPDDVVNFMVGYLSEKEEELSTLQNSCTGKLDEQGFPAMFSHRWPKIPHERRNTARAFIKNIAPLIQDIETAILQNQPTDVLPFLIHYLATNHDRLTVLIPNPYVEEPNEERKSSLRQVQRVKIYRISGRDSEESSARQGSSDNTDQGEVVKATQIRSLEGKQSSSSNTSSKSVECTKKPPKDLRLRKKISREQQQQSDVNDATRQPVSATYGAVPSVTSTAADHLSKAADHLSIAARHLSREQVASSRLERTTMEDSHGHSKEKLGLSHTQRQTKPFLSKMTTLDEMPHQSEHSAERTSAVSSHIPYATDGTMSTDMSTFLTSTAPLGTDHLAVLHSKPGSRVLSMVSRRMHDQNGLNVDEQEILSIVQAADAGKPEAGKFDGGALKLHPGNDCTCSMDVSQRQTVAMTGSVTAERPNFPCPIHKKVHVSLIRESRFGARQQVGDATVERGTLPLDIQEHMPVVMEKMDFAGMNELENYAHDRASNIKGDSRSKSWSLTRTSIAKGLDHILSLMQKTTEEPQDMENAEIILPPTNLEKTYSPHRQEKPSFFRTEEIFNRKSSQIKIPSQPQKRSSYRMRNILQRNSHAKPTYLPQIEVSDSPQTEEEYSQTKESLPIEEMYSMSRTPNFEDAYSQFYPSAKKAAAERVFQRSDRKDRNVKFESPQSYAPFHSPISTEVYTPLQSSQDAEAYVPFRSPEHEETPQSFASPQGELTGSPRRSLTKTPPKHAAVQPKTRSTEMLSTVLASPNETIKKDVNSSLYSYKKSKPTVIEDVPELYHQIEAYDQIPLITELDDIVKNFNSQNYADATGKSTLPLTLARISNIVQNMLPSFLSDGNQTSNQENTSPTSDDSTIISPATDDQEDSEEFQSIDITELEERREKSSMSDTRLHSFRGKRSHYCASSDDSNVHSQHMKDLKVIEPFVTTLKSNTPNGWSRDAHKDPAHYHNLEYDKKNGVKISMVDSTSASITKNESHFIPGSAIEVNENNLIQPISGMMLVSDKGKSMPRFHLMSESESSTSTYNPFTTESFKLKMSANPGGAAPCVGQYIKKPLNEKEVMDEFSSILCDKSAQKKRRLRLSPMGDTKEPTEAISKTSDEDIKSPVITEQKKPKDPRSRCDCPGSVITCALDDFMANIDEKKPTQDEEEPFCGLQILKSWSGSSPESVDEEECKRRMESTKSMLQELEDYLDNKKKCPKPKCGCGKPSNTCGSCGKSRKGTLKASSPSSDSCGTSCSQSSASSPGSRSCQSPLSGSDSTCQCRAAHSSLSEKIEDLLFTVVIVPTDKNTCCKDKSEDSGKTKGPEVTVIKNSPGEKKQVKIVLHDEGRGCHTCNRKKDDNKNPMEMIQEYLELSPQETSALQQSIWELAYAFVCGGEGGEGGGGSESSSGTQFDNPCKFLDKADELKKDLDSLQLEQTPGSSSVFTSCYSPVSSKYQTPPTG